MALRRDEHPAVEREFELYGCDELDSIDEGLRRLLLWRALQFRELGLGRRAAVALADSRADLAQARKLAGAGCPTGLMEQILV